MPNNKSAWKRMRQNRIRSERNAKYKSAIRTARKKVLIAVDKSDKEKAVEDLMNAIKIINKACSKGVIHRNTRSRKISRLTRKVNTIASTPA